MGQVKLGQANEIILLVTKRDIHKFDEIDF